MTLLCIYRLPHLDPGLLGSASIGYIVSNLCPIRDTRLRTLGIAQRILHCF